MRLARQKLMDRVKSWVAPIIPGSLVAYLRQPFICRPTSKLRMGGATTILAFTTGATSEPDRVASDPRGEPKEGGAGQGEEQG